ncbi:hypothetical protein ACFQ7M_35740 [Streptomyces massasporeus]
MQQPRHAAAVVAGAGAVLDAGDCWAAAKSGRCRPATRQQAIEALR